MENSEKDKEKIQQAISDNKRKIRNFEAKIATLKNEILSLESRLREIENANNESTESNPLETTDKEANYESIVIFRPNITEEEILRAENKIKTFVEIKEAENLGIKKLAYEVAGNKEGYYYRIKFYVDNSSSQISDLEKYFRINNDILKFVTVRYGII